MLALSLLLAASTALAAGLPLAVTIDDLPACPREQEEAMSVLRTLKAEKVPGVVAFVTSGDHTGAGTVISAWRKAGYRFGNHTELHADLAAVTAEEFERQVLGCEKFLKRIAPGSRARFFRFPFLTEGAEPAKRARVRDFLRAKGYRVAPATVPLGDSRWNAVYRACASSPAAARKLEDEFVAAAGKALARAEKQGRELAGRPVAQVLLLHPEPLVAATLPRLLAGFRAAGYRFVSLERALADEVLARVPAEAPRDRFFLDALLGTKPEGFDPAALIPHEACLGAVRGYDFTHEQAPAARR